MKKNKIICVCLVMLILFNTLICPISFAAYIFGPENSSCSVNWQSLAVEYRKPDDDPNDEKYNEIYSTLQTIPVQVSTSGIYSVSNMFGGNISSNFIISGYVGVGDDGMGKVVPLPVATYGKNGENTMDLSSYNNAKNKSASVYLESGKTYYISFVSKEGKAVDTKKLTQSQTAEVYLKHIPMNSDDVVYETEISSMDYTAAGITLEGTWQYSLGTDRSARLEKGKTPNVTRILNGIGLDQRELCITKDIISGDSIEKALKNAAEVEETEENASWIETIATDVVVFLCDCLRAAIGSAMGDEGISIDDLLFNNYPNVRLSIFASSRGGDKENGYLANSGMLDYIDESGKTKEGVITKYFMLFRNIAIAIYIVMLLYMGVSILLHSTGKQKEKYKSKMTDWVKGIIILAFFPYIMKYTIVLNDAIVEYIEEVKLNLDLPIDLPTMTGVSDVQGASMDIVNSNAGNGNIMETMRASAKKTGRLAYAMLYLFLLKEMIGFIYIYFKRLISVIFLIIIFPLVVISYAVDKIGDGKSQAFNTWYKEFTLNVFMQAFQAVNYVLIMSIIFALTASGGATNIILMLIGLEYISKGDELLRGMFTKMSGGGASSVPRSVSEATKTVAKVAVIKKATENITNVGKRFTNVAHKVSDVRDAYNEHIGQKLDEKIREKETAKQNWDRSILNPEWYATRNVDSNIDKILSAPGTYSDEEMKVTLDRLFIAQNDSELKAAFDTKYASLTEDQQNQLNDLMAKSNAINETVNGNVGINGVLTNLEINFNAKMLVEIFVNGKKVERYMNGSYTGRITEKEQKDYKLYKYMQSKKMTDGNGNVLRDTDGSEMTLARYSARKTASRTLSDKQLNTIKELQRFSGNVTGIDDSSRTGSDRTTTNRHDALRRMRVSRSEQDRKDSLLNRGNSVGPTGVSANIMAKREEAAKLVSRIKEYSDAVKSGTSEGCSATEMMQLSKKWKDLSTETDAGVVEILSKLSDTAETDLSVKSDVEFNLEQFETMASLAVVSDKEHLEGSQNQQDQMYHDAIQKIVEVYNGDRSVDPVAKKMVYRAEVDDIIEEFSSDTRIEKTRNYIRTAGTQEEKRSARELYAQRVRLESDYERLQRTSAQTRAKLIRSSVELGGATLSAAASPLNIAAGVTSTALLSGSTKAQVDPGTIASTMVIGTSIENTVERVIPGSQAAGSSSKTVGARLSEAIKDSASNASETIVNEQLVVRQRKDRTARANIDKYNEKFS